MSAADVTRTGCVLFFSPEHHHLPDLVGDRSREALVLDHLGPDRLPGLLVQLVDSRADGAELLRGHAWDGMKGARGRWV